MIDKALEKKANDILDALNTMVIDYPALALTMSRVGHRTLQQSFTRLCLEWLRVCAAEGYRTDARNEDSHRVAKLLLENADEKELYTRFI